MSVITAVEQMAEPIGFDIAQSNNEVQAAFFNGFGRGMYYPNLDHMDMQICYLVNGLTREAKATIRKLAEFCGEEG